MQLIGPAQRYFEDDYMQRTFVGWEDSGACVDRVWTGVMGYSTDSLPHVGEVPGRDGVFIIAGFHGHGMPVIFLAAEGIAAMTQGLAYEKTGLPSLFKTSRDRLESERNDILAEELEGCVLFASHKQQETQRLRERNRIAKRASRARQRQREQHNDTTANVAVQRIATAEATAQDVDVDLAPPLQPPQHPGSGSGSDYAYVRAEATEDLDPSRLLHIAACNGTTGILLSLIKAGADVNSRDCSGTILLHIAVRFRRASALELLVNHGANINARDSANMTALEVAVRAQDEELVNGLLSGGAELH
ncbi:ankyrin repeat-containing domain protein [Fusarium sp. MPI-SDFR-AT-0072]|nr:ankyrin repeat-containing domain protein [Fusarium sp. MPI-SDFR-AT-0072]